MVTAKQAYEKVLKKHPHEYVHMMNEFAENYAFLLMNKGEVVGPATFFCEYTIVNKETGDVTEEVPAFDSAFQGNYKQYTMEDLEGL